MDSVKVGDWVRSEIDYQTTDMWIPYRTAMKVQTVIWGIEVITVSGNVDGVIYYLSNTTRQKQFTRISEPPIKSGDMVRVTYDWDTDGLADLCKGDILQVHKVLVGYMNDDHLSVQCYHGENSWIMTVGGKRRPEWEKV